MFRFSRVLGVVLAVAVTAVNVSSVVLAQELGVEPSTAASGLWNSGLAEAGTLGWSNPTAKRSAAIVDRLPSKYLQGDRDESSADESSATFLVDLYAVDRVRENWLIVAMLGFGFGVGLVLTLAMVRRATISQSPSPMF